MIFYSRRDKCVRLVCDAEGPRRAVECHAREDFEAGAKVVRWMKRQGWYSRHRGGRLWDHLCPACAQISRTSADYQARLHA